MNLERELGRLLRQAAGETEPRRERPRGVVVTYTVRRPDGGAPFRFEHRSPAGTWPSAAEANARRAINTAGLIVWAHISTQDAQA